MRTLQGIGGHLFHTPKGWKGWWGNMAHLDEAYVAFLLSVQTVLGADHPHLEWTPQNRPFGVWCPRLQVQSIVGAYNARKYPETHYGTWGLPPFEARFLPKKFNSLDVLLERWFPDLSYLCYQRLVSSVVKHSLYAKDGNIHEVVVVDLTDLYEFFKTNGLTIP